MEYLCILSRSRISELSKIELSLLNIKRFFKLLLSHQFSLQETGLRLCHELPPSTHRGCGKTLGSRRTRWLLPAPGILGLCVHFFPWVPCEGLFLAVWVVRDVLCSPVPARVGCFPASTGCGSWGGAGLQLEHLRVEITLVISARLCLSCPHPWNSVCDLICLEGN